MKPLLFLSFLLITGSLSSQVCGDGYYPFKSGVSWQTGSYDVSDKLLGKNDCTINAVTKTTAGFKANVTSKSEDAKGKETSNSTFDVECIDNVMHMDMKSMLNPEQMSAYKDMSVTFSGDQLETPKTFKIGDTLKAGSMTMTVKSNDMVIATMEIEIYERVVLAKEQMTVPAGAYSCYKISYKTRVNMSMSGIPIKTEMQTTQWLSAGVGAVRTENYSKGKMTGYTQLTRFTN
jgi:hypothetical protein